MYGIFIYMSHKKQPIVGKYTSPHGSYGFYKKRNGSQSIRIGQTPRFGSSVQILVFTEVMVDIDGDVVDFCKALGEFL